MDIHHAMIVRDASPAKVYSALTEQEDLAVWMNAPARARPEVGAEIELQYDQGNSFLRLVITQLEQNRLVQWRVTQPKWAIAEGTEAQIVTWTLSPYENSTLVDFRMEGWLDGDESYPSLSYKWASFMLRLRVYLGDPRDIADFLSKI